MLRKNLSTFSEKNFEAIWTKLTTETQASVKKEIFIILTNESASNIRHHICDLIGEIAGTILSIDDDSNSLHVEAKTWPDVIQNIFALYESGTPSLIEASLKIIATMFTYASEELGNYRKQLHTIFKNSLEMDDINIKVASIEAIASYIQMSEPKNCKIMEELIPSILNNLLFILSKDEYQVNLKILINFLFS